MLPSKDAQVKETLRFFSVFRGGRIFGPYAVREEISGKEWPTSEIYDVDVFGITQFDVSSRGIADDGKTRIATRSRMNEY